ncbi:MAG: NADH-quinone oxidoreductase subunit N, partial [Duncaniella sp.]|nr:NADH-quinone oxidoreductase subunit N [Duncaniella sp.]
MTPLAMDYSQFLALKQEIGLFIVFLIVFFYDTFASRKAQGALPVVSTLLMAVFTLWGFCPDVRVEAEAFAGMYVTSPVLVAIKNILNVG